MKRLRRESIKHLKPRNRPEAIRIQYIIYQLGRERGEAVEKKAFQILENWLARDWILSYDQSPKWGYDDYIRHVDGWLMTLDGEMVDFQIKSSRRAAQKHLEKYPDIKVIVVSSGIGIDELDQQMMRLFKDKLPEFVWRKS